MNGNSVALINLLRGWPNPGFLPHIQIKAAAARNLSDPKVYVPGLLYGPDEGYEPLREQLALWLTKFYRPKDAIRAERICITGGASQNLACLLQVYTDPVYTRNIWMVSPTYFRACPIFEDAGFQGRLRSVPEDDQGIDINFLRKGMQKSEREAAARGNMIPEIKRPRPYSKIYRHIIFAVPTFSNPSAKTMTLLRRQQLVMLARELDALVITDDVYDQLQWTASPESEVTLLEAVQPRLVDVDRYLNGGAERPGADGFGNTVSNGSFSKIAGPGCRTGWAESTPKLAYGLSQNGASASGGAPSQLTATLMTDLLQSGALADHISHTLKPAYARRYRTVMKAIEEILVPLGVTVDQPSCKVVGGYFLWLSLPEPLLADDLATRAEADQCVIVGPGSLFGVYGDEEVVDMSNKLRICFAWEREDALREGIERIGRAVKTMKENGTPTTTNSKYDIGKASY